MLLLNIDAPGTADAINALHDDAAEDGKSITIHGHRVVSPFGMRPATSWGTGSVSVSVHSDTARSRSRDLWIKRGETVLVVTS